MLCIQVEAGGVCYPIVSIKNAREASTSSALPADRCGRLRIPGCEHEIAAWTALQHHHDLF